MSIENDITAKVFGKILAEGMSLADCELENRIEREAVVMLKEIKNVISANGDDKKKIEKLCWKRG